MQIRIAQFAAIILTALALVPAGAHLLELPNKIGLGRDHYMIVQAIYRGWAMLGVILIAAVLANLIVAVLARNHATPMWWALSSAVLLCATLAIFFTWTFSANQATGNWSNAPENWDLLRLHWEYSHAINAVLTFAAFCATTLSAFVWPD